MTPGTLRAGGNFDLPRTRRLAAGYRRTIAANVLSSREMRVCRRGFWGALGLLGLVMVARGQYTVTNAYVDLDAVVIWDDPQTLDLTDINALVSFAIPFADPTQEAKGSLTGALPRRGQVLSIRRVVVPSPVVPSSRTRAPPTLSDRQA